MSARFDVFTPLRDRARGPLTPLAAPYQLRTDPQRITVKITRRPHLVACAGSARVCTDLRGVWALCVARAQRPEPGGQGRIGRMSCSRKSTTAFENASFWSPATMWAAPPTSTSLASGDLPEEVLDALVGDHVAEQAAHEQRRDPDVAQRHLEQPLEVLAGDLGPIVGEELRVPVPVPPAVGALAEDLHQPGRVDPLGPVGRVARDGVGGVFEGGEALEARGHEVTDAVDALRVAPVGDVDDHQAARHDPVAGPLGDHRRHPAQRRTRPAPADDRAGRRSPRSRPSRR